MCSFVRELTRVEGQQLSRILKSSTNAVMLRRAQVVAFSGQGMQAKHIAKQLCLHEEYVRELIRRFDAGSFEALKPKPRTGRPRELEPEEVAQVVEIATMRPKDFGLPLTTWSLRIAVSPCCTMRAAHRRRQCNLRSAAERSTSTPRSLPIDGAKSRVSPSVSAPTRSMRSSTRRTGGRSRTHRGRSVGGPW